MAMNLKKYAGKDVWIQFKSGQSWIAVEADKQGRLEVSTMPTINPQTHEPELAPVPLPAINARVSEDGEELIIEKRNGGVISLWFSADVIHSIVSTVKPASSLITAQSALVS